MFDMKITLHCGWPFSREPVQTSGTDPGPNIRDHKKDQGTQLC